MLEKLRSGEPLTAKEKPIHDQGLVTVLRQLHDELDQAVLEAYGWGDLSARSDIGIPACSSAPGAPPEEAGRNAYITELLTRLVALNHERAAEEKRGLIRYLRPEYQNPNASASDGHRPPLQGDLAGTESSSTDLPKHRSTETQAHWPDRLPEQVALLRKLMGGYDKSVVTPDAEALSALFGHNNKKRSEQIEGILETLKGLGQL